MSRLYGQNIHLLSNRVKSALSCITEEESDTALIIRN